MAKTYITCVTCGKSELEIKQDVDGDDFKWWQGLPLGWLERRTSEGAGEAACSLACAQAYDAKLRREDDERRIEYERRRAAGGLSPSELWGEELLERYLRSSPLIRKSSNG